MAKKHPTLGMKSDGKALRIDIDTLLETRLLVQANSGAGKSWAIRRILEQTYGAVQQIVIDVEGEFHTLREKFDYLLIGGEQGDCPLAPAAAKLLAHRLLKLRCSAIIQIDELEAHQRYAFVRSFLKALIGAPKSIRNPSLIVIDEAHVFAPEKGKAESTAAVIDLMTRGRKRGLCGVLATQRISKLHKDATAEANNKLIGRAAQDIDRKRAGEELGLVHREDILSLRNLKPGEFYAFGPALIEAVTGILVGPVATTHPKTGQRTVPVPPPRGAVKRLLAELQDLPQEAVQEAQDLASARAELKALRAEIQALKAAEKRSADQSVRVMKVSATHSTRERELEEHLRGLKKKIAAVSKQQMAMVNRVARIIGGLETDAKEAWELIGEFKAVDQIVDVAPKTFPVKHQAPTPKPARTEVDTTVLTGGNGSSEFSPTTGIGKILAVLTSRYPIKLTKRQLATMAGMKHSGGSFRTYLSRLKVGGYIEPVDGNYFQATQMGLDAMGAEPVAPQTTDELVDMWVNSVGGKAGDMLRAVVDRHPDEISKDELATMVDMTVEGGSFRTYLSRLRSNGLVEGKDQIRASDTLFI